jgi:hypothetical protein
MVEEELALEEEDAEELESVEEEPNPKPFA